MGNKKPSWIHHHHHHYPGNFREEETWRLLGSSMKISSGEGKEGPLSSLQQAPQPREHCHLGAIFFSPFPKPVTRSLEATMAAFPSSSFLHTFLLLLYPLLWLAILPSVPALLVRHLTRGAIAAVVGLVKLRAAIIVVPNTVEEWAFG